MSIMRCCHCQRHWDSDFEEHCPVCLTKDTTEEQCEGMPGEACVSCGKLIG
jgi:hypothetical protein